MNRTTMMPIEKFAAQYDRYMPDGQFELHPCTVVGICLDADGMERFVVIKTDPDDGTIYADNACSVFPATQH